MINNDKRTLIKLYTTTYAVCNRTDASDHSILNKPTTWLEALSHWPNQYENQYKTPLESEQMIAYRQSS